MTPLRCIFRRGLPGQAFGGAEWVGVGAAARSGRLIVEFGSEGLDAGVDVVANDSHAFDTVDATQGGFVGVSPSSRGAGVVLELGLGADEDDQVRIIGHLPGQLDRLMVADVDADFGEHLC